MPTEFLYATSHIAGDFANPNNALGNTPGTWAGTLNTNVTETSRWAIGNPSDDLEGTQTIRVVARKGTNSGNPDIELTLYENGSAVQALGATTTITSTAGQTITRTFAASVITNPANIEIEVVGRHVGGNAQTRNSPQISHIEFEASVVESGPVTITPDNSIVSVVSTQPFVGEPPPPFFAWHLVHHDFEDNILPSSWFASGAVDVVNETIEIGHGGLVESPYSNFERSFIMLRITDVPNTDDNLLVSAEVEFEGDSAEVRFEIEEISGSLFLNMYCNGFSDTVAYDPIAHRYLVLAAELDNNNTHAVSIFVSSTGYGWTRLLTNNAFWGDETSVPGRLVVNVTSNDTNAVVKIESVNTPDTYIFNNLPGSPHGAWGGISSKSTIVRNSVGDLYTFLHVRLIIGGDGGGALTAWKSTDNGATWTHVDPGGQPHRGHLDDWEGGTGHRVDPQFSAFGVALDSNDVIHLSWCSGGHRDGGFGSFDTNTDKFSTRQRVILTVPEGFGEHSRAVLAVGANDIPHAAYIYFDDGVGGGMLEYVRNTGDYESFDIIIIEDTQQSFEAINGVEIAVVDNVPIIFYAYSNNLYVAVADDPVPTQFDVYLVATNYVSDSGVSHKTIDYAVHANGDLDLFFRNTSNQLSGVRHLASEPWDTWETVQSSGRAANSLNAFIQDGVSHILYLSGSVFELNTFIGTGFGTHETVVDPDPATGSIIDARTRILNSVPYDTHGLDYIYTTSADDNRNYGSFSPATGDSVNPDNSNVSVNTTEPTLTQKHVIQPEDSAVAVNTTEATTSVASDIGVDDTSVNVISTEPTLTQKHVIQPDDSVVSVVTTEAVLAAAGVVGVDDTSVSVSTTEPTLTQSHVIQPDNSSVGVVSTQPNITPSGITYTSGSEVVQDTVVQAEPIVPDDSIVSVITTEPTLSHKYTIQPNNASVGVSTEEVSLTQSHTLQPDDSQVVVVTEESELSSAGHIGVTNTSVNVTTTEPSLTQSHNIQPDNSIVEVNTTEAGLTQKHNLQPDNSTVLVEFTQPSIVQAHILQVDDSIVSVSTTQATISTAGTINPDDSIVAVSSSEASLTQSHILIPDDSQSQVFTSATSVSASYTISVDSSLVGVSTTEPDLDVAVGFIQPHDSMVVVVTTQPAFTTSGFRNIDVDPLDGPIIYTTVSDAHLSVLFIGETHLGPLGISAPSVVFIEDVSVGIWIVGEPHLGPIAVGEPHVGMIVSEPAI